MPINLPWKKKNPQPHAHVVLPPKRDVLQETHDKIRESNVNRINEYIKGYYDRLKDLSQKEKESMEKLAEHNNFDWVDKWHQQVLESATGHEKKILRSILHMQAQIKKAAEELIVELNSKIRLLEIQVEKSEVLSPKYEKALEEVKRKGAVFDRFVDSFTKKLKNAGDDPKEDRHVKRLIEEYRLEMEKHGKELKRMIKEIPAKPTDLRFLRGEISRIKGEIAAIHEDMVTSFERKIQSEFRMRANFFPSVFELRERQVNFLLQQADYQRRLLSFEARLLAFMRRKLEEEKDVLKPVAIPKQAVNAPQGIHIVP